MHMVGTGEKETTDSKQMNSQSKQENQITFSSTQDLLRRPPFRCRRETSETMAENSAPGTQQTFVQILALTIYDWAGFG